MAGRCPLVLNTLFVHQGMMQATKLNELQAADVTDVSGKRVTVTQRHVDWYKAAIIIIDESDDLTNSSNGHTETFEQYVAYWLLHKTIVICLTATPFFNDQNPKEREIVKSWW